MRVVFLALSVGFVTATRDTTCSWTGSSCMPNWMQDWFKTTSICNGCGRFSNDPEMCVKFGCLGSPSTRCTMMDFKGTQVCAHAPLYADPDTIGQAHCNQIKNQAVCDNDQEETCRWVFSMCWQEDFLQSYVACGFKDRKRVTEENCSTSGTPTDPPTEQPTEPPTSVPSCKTFKNRNDFQGCKNAPHCKAKGKAAKFKKCKELKCKSMRKKNRCDALAASPLKCVWNPSGGKGSKGRCDDPPKN